MEKIVVYTASSGNYDVVVDPLFVTPGVDYICFTDQNVKSNIWEVRNLPELSLDQIRRARFPKILPHKVLPEYDISIWIDARACIVGDIADLIEFLNGFDMIICKHSRRRSSLEEEVEACVRSKRDKEKILTNQIETYRQYGLPASVPVCETGLLLRRHNSIDIKMAMEDWWNEIVKFSHRDQISFNYIFWKHSLAINVITEFTATKNKWTSWNHHII